ncbi:unnamed protein product [Calicophoron daubneyi]|uniref:Uncharacterized protein n=1 Tax=Calicophoron daubneyi TaxID=300641 RepID=A0AAV2T6K6_CALDB
MCCSLDRLSVACQDLQDKCAVDFDSGSGSCSIPKRICIEALETGQPLYVDIFETSLEQRELDRGIVSSEKNSQISLSKIETILKCFMDMAPSGLPNAVAALFHCRLVCYLSDLHSAYLRCRTEGDDDLGDNIWIPDIFRYTKSLLDREWDTSVRWKGYTYRDSLQSILSAHLRSRPVLEDSSRLKSSIASRLSPDLVLDFTRGLVIPTIRQYIGGQRRSGSTVLGTSGCWVGYRTLTRQTADLYCREIMETILWFTEQLCAVQKGMNNGTVDDPVNENLLLAAWNECVVVLCLLVDVMRTSGSGGQADCHLTVSLRPPLMRIGRMFLQLLMKSAMPLLNSLFRHRAVEVTTFLRNTQSLTRYLQRVCTHAKAYRDSQLTNQIPATRRCLETFVYRVKVVLSQNHCAEAFWLGTLKNRDLHGVDLQEEESQRSSLAQISSGGSYSQSLPGNTVRSNSDSDSDGNSDTESRPRTIPSSVELDNAADLGRIVGEEEEEEIEDSSETDADVVEASETDE